MVVCVPVFIQYHLSHVVSVMLVSNALGGSTTVSSDVSEAFAMTAAGCSSELFAAPAPAAARLAAARGEAVAS